jgi:hypothetical protein
MKNIITKLAVAKQQVATEKNAKAWKNSFSNYNYFTPEQVNSIVQKVCDTCWLLTKFDLKRNEYGVFWTLTVYDIESWESLEFESATAIPEIKATNVAQQMWGCMTYTERYLKMTAFWIIDNSLDFDSDEQYKARQKTTKKSESKKEWNPNWWFQKAINAKDFMRQCMNEEDYIKKIKDKYEVDEIVEWQLRKAYQDATSEDTVDLPFS